MRNVMKLLVIGLFLMSSCSEEEQCMSEAYVIEAGSQSSFGKSSVGKEDDLVLTEDLFIVGNIDYNTIKLNGYTLQVSGIINATFVKLQGGIMIAEFSIIVEEEVKLQGGSMYADSIYLYGTLIGPGNVYHCDEFESSGSITNDPNIEQYCGGIISVLSDNSINFKIEEVPCTYIGKTIDGFTYLPLN